MRGSGLQSYCISTVPGGQKEDDCRDAGGRATQATGRDAGELRLQGREEVELRREQQPRTTQEQLSERLPS